MLKNIIYLTARNRKKIAEMCVALLPKVGYARVTHSGIVVLKKSKWSLFGKRIPVTDIVMKYIPIEVGKLIYRGQDRAVYVSLFNDKVATIVSLTKYCDRMDLLDIVYREYMKACMIIEPADIDILLDYKEPIAISNQAFKIKELLKNMKASTNKSKLSDKIKTLQSRISDSTKITRIINMQVRTN